MNSFIFLIWYLEAIRRICKVEVKILEVVFMKLGEKIKRTVSPEEEATPHVFNL